MDVDGFLRALRASPSYHGQIAHIHEAPARPARYAEDWAGLAPAVVAALQRLGIERLYSHQAEALRAVHAGRDVLIVTGTASGKSLCYAAPILERLQAEPTARALLLFPTKALCQDQAQSFGGGLARAAPERLLSGVFDGDTPPNLRRKLRDHGAAVFSNPDMLHAALLPQHTRWATFLSGLCYVVLDELHTYSGLFGANMANLMRRFLRVCAQYGSRPQFIACSATIGNPSELAERLLGRPVTLVDADGSPRGRRVYVFWNPPVVRGTTWRSRRSANVEAHELMAELIRRGVPTITFSKAKMTAEMIHRYVCEALTKDAPQLAARVTPYRAGYRPEERRAIERRLFSGELLGVSTTRALELGIDVGALEACVVVGYPGTRAGFLQQSGRAGRGARDALVVLVGLDTTVNQFVMTHPDYIFERAVEQAVVEADNPFVVLGHLRCAAHEGPLAEPELRPFGPHAGLALRILEENRKVHRVGARWYHSSAEIPQHELSLRGSVEKNVLIQDVDTGAVLGEVSKLDASPILHPGAIYMHQGDTYRVLTLDFEKCVATVKREEVDYYTYPYGGTDVEHIDALLREKPFGAGRACWGEVTARFEMTYYEKVRFYEMDALSAHSVDLPKFYLETMAYWLIPPEDLMGQVRRAGLDVHQGLRGIGYATRMLLPLFITCDTLDLSHSVGCVNAPWNTIFIYERHPLGLGYTHRAYERLHEILPAVLAHVRACPCTDGCPCCVGKPLRGYANWNVERGEAQIPSKQAARMILEGLLGDGTRLACPDMQALTDSAAAQQLRLEQALRRRLERGREPQVLHPIAPQVERGYPEAERRETLGTPDVARRAERRGAFEADFRRRLGQRLAQARAAEAHAAEAHAGGELPPRVRGGLGRGPEQLPLAATDAAPAPPPPPEARGAEIPPPPPVPLGDALAARARRLKKKPGAST